MPAPNASPGPQMWRAIQSGASGLRASPPAVPAGPTDQPAQVQSEARTPEFNRLVGDLRLRTTTLTKWLALRSALKSIGYSKDEIARTREALRSKAVSHHDANLFCGRWHERHHEVINPGQLIAVLRQLLESESPLLAGKE